MISELLPGDVNNVARQNSSYYDTKWSIQEYTAEVGLRPVEADIVRRYFPAPPARVLDVGCGAGRTTGELARIGYDVVAIDLSPVLLEQARERYPGVKFLRMDATRLSFADSSFDAAIFSFNGMDCIYPLESRRACIKEIYRVLKPGAPFTMSSHNLVGAVFSGGYFFLRGYIRALRFLLAQTNNPLARDWFLRYADDGGTQHLYSAPPGETVRQLKSAGFQYAEMRGGQNFASERKTALREQHVYFVVRKP